ncbi:MAG: FAD-dependent oxidoreductase [Ruminococcaceae bacterium]|nr:FAD-dependent oxidoreductase [Oscillospiraceae bacterium]
MALPSKHHRTQFCIIGGGIAGMCAAISAARHGTKVLLMHERPMLGGNASSEIRMWVSGAGGENNRETGILEEIRMLNYHRNQEKSYAIWDTILYEMVINEPNITLLLNCSCFDATMDGDRIVSVKGWQLTTQTFHTVEADYFADCSGDSILAPLTGAEYRVGREAASEFNEKVSTEVADRKTMGMSCLIQARKYDHAIPFIAPEWAAKIPPEPLKFRVPNLESASQNFWYLELGGEQDSIHDTEIIRDDLIALALGLWDHVKNSGEFPGSEYWQLEFLGFLPGKRESRRMVGDYIMTQTDVLSGGHFPDVVAFGGWPLDDHHPGGFYHVGHPNTWGETPAPYGIPYRTLYSRNIANLFFAGRNISMTHAAMSSTRVMATCALVGQAMGTAAYIAARESCSPRGVYESHLDELQQTLMYDDCFLPGTRRRMSELTEKAALLCDTTMEGIDNLRNGADRNNWTYGDEEQGFFCPKGSTVTYILQDTANVKRVRLLMDSDLDRNTVLVDDDSMPHGWVERKHNTRAQWGFNLPIVNVPLTMMKAFTVEYADEAGEYHLLYETDCNVKRLIDLPLDKTVTAVRVRLWKDWGDRDTLHLFSFDID